MSIPSVPSPPLYFLTPYRAYLLTATLSYNRVNHGRLGSYGAIPSYIEHPLVFSYFLLPVSRVQCIPSGASIDHTELRFAERMIPRYQQYRVGSRLRVMPLQNLAVTCDTHSHLLISDNVQTRNVGGNTESDTAVLVVRGAT